ncbi:peptidoglycan-N-acetylglucosamine deacetylase PgdA [Streptococcus hohhotensis]|uniref:Polysaccharide deacetylase family protein n=1 Tax=Streptococcus hohhotensis TaxID=2866998 RepID=A0ABT6QDV7_9STRE|nr:polysaccharide deacetylase family protein [Streptococcus sp. IMAU 99199]MDI2139655.1 polysaccharide deacetylase family protein [Streptococcus sp. IMAU 99199]
MDKSRAKRENHDKIRMSLIALVAIFSVSICVLGLMIGYKIYTKQSFEQKIESLKKEKDDQLSEGNQKDHFRKGQVEVIAYYPLQGEQVISSVKEIMTQDIKENLEDKENLVFYYTEKQDSTLKGIVNRSVMKQVYDLTSLKVEETEKTSLAKVHLTEDGKPFTLDQLFSDASKAKEQLIKELTSFLQDKKLEQEKVDQIVKGLSDQDLSAWNFDYKDSQILIYPSQPIENLDEIALPVSSFFEVIQSSYLLDKDAELYKAYYEKKNRKVVALTFDDGPNPATTNQALDTLSKYGIKATFFVLGKNVSGNEEILKRMKADGHVIGNHSWSHPVLSKLSLDEAKKQITDTEDALTKVLGSSSKLMRPPYGAITDDIRNSLDLSFIMWDVDSLDWKSKNEAAILTEIQREVKNGSIILMHDIHAETVNALPKVIDYLKGQGYDFVTVPDLLDSRLKAHQLYYDRDQ